MRSTATAAAALASLAAAAADPGTLGLGVEEMASEIASAHGLEHGAAIPTVWLDAAGMDSRLRAIVAADYTPEEIVDEGRLFSRLGLLPPSTSYEDIVFGLLGEQVVGLYDPRAQELVLAAGAPVPVEAVLVHELTHALQDGSFDLSLLAGRAPGRADEASALHAVAEGDALLTELVVAGAPLPFGISPEAMLSMMGELGGGAAADGTELAKAPGIVRDSLLFPYVYGLPLAMNAYAGGGFAAVNALLEDPPASTEQVMHPDKIGVDPPVAVAIARPAGLATAYRVAGTDVLGEFGLRSWLSRWIPQEDAAAAAAGWGGDRYVFLWPQSTGVGDGHLDHGIIAISTRWDPAAPSASRSEAEEFEAALGCYLDARFPGAAIEADGMTFAPIPGGDWAAIVREGDGVIYVEGVPASGWPDPAALIDEIAGRAG